MKLRMTENSKFFGIILSELILEVIMWIKHFLFVFPQVYIKYKDITNRWVVHSTIKPTDNNELFNRNFIINEFKFSLNNYAKTKASVVAEKK